MEPSAFVTLTALPLTPNGKVDRRALPAPDTTRPELESLFVAPRTPVEEALSEIWAKALHLDRVGIYDDFFELGGHSLLATRLLHRVRESFHVDVSLATLFADPTIAHLAATVEQRQAGLKTFEEEFAGRDKPKIRALPRGKGNLDQLVAKLEQLSDHGVR
jgi:aryl carrier-like protein